MWRESAMLCVTKSIASCLSARRVRSVPMIDAWTLTSSAEVISSQTSTDGALTRALAIAALCRSPPERSPGRRW